MSYLTVERYRAMSFGIDTTDMEDVALASVLNQASTVADMYCAAPQLPQPHKFSGGTITGEQHRWSLGTDTIRATRRVYPVHRPLKAVSAFRILVTPTIKVEIGSNDIFINNQDGYIELVSFAAVRFGVFPVGVVPNLGLLVPVAETDYTYGYSFPVTGDRLYATDGMTFRGQANYWAADPAPVLYVGGAVASGGTYAIDYEDGSVKFTSLVSDSVTADYTYTLPQPFAYATGEIATSLLGERDLAAKGMRALAGMDLAEISLRRTLRGNDVRSEVSTSIPETALTLLAPYRFQTVQ